MLHFAGLFGGEGERGSPIEGDLSSATRQQILLLDPAANCLIPQQTTCFLSELL